MSGIVQRDCFAYDHTNHNCRCLETLECENCKFYKHIDTVDFDDMNESIELYKLTHPEEDENK